MLELGAVLYQQDVEGSDRPIAFFSAKLRGAQLNYSITEKECLAAKKAVERFRLFDFETTEFESPEYLERLQMIEEHGRDKFPDLRVEERLLFKKTHFDREEFEWKLSVPEALTTTPIQQAHGSDMAMHGGMEKTLARLQRMYYWPKMVIQVREFVSACENCKENKHITQIKRPVMGYEVRKDRPIQKLYLDFLGKYPRSHRGNTMLFIALDHLTKFVWLKANPKATSTAVVRFLQEGIFTQFGVPETIHTDNGRQFISKEFENMLQKYGITHMKTGRYIIQCFGESKSIRASSHSSEHPGRPHAMG